MLELERKTNVPIDVYLATQTYTGNLLWRNYISAGVIQYWRDTPLVRVHVQYGLTQRARRMEADQLSSFYYYIVADDDCIPIGKYFIHQGMEMLDRYPDFAMLSPISYEDPIGLWQQGRVDTKDLFEAGSIGGIRFCRQDALKGWPKQTRVGYDVEQGEALRRGGWKSGYLKELRMIHIGSRNSSIWSRPGATEVV